MNSKIAAYLTHLEARGARPNTLKAYQRDLADALAGVDSPADLTPALLDDKFAALRARLSASSVNRISAAVRGICKWLVDTDVLDRDPARLLRTKRAPAPPKEYLDGGDVKKLLNAMAQMKGARAARDLAAFSLMAWGGLRVGEVVSLDLADRIDAKNVRVVVKGGRTEKTFLCVAAREALDQWLVARSQLPVSADQKALFPGRNGEGRMTAENLRQRLAEWCEIAGVKVISPHGLRHGLASKMLRDGTNLRLIQETLHHRHSATTERYAHADSRDVEAAIEKAAGER